MFFAKTPNIIKTQRLNFLAGFLHNHNLLNFKTGFYY